MIEAVVDEGDDLFEAETVCHVAEREGVVLEVGHVRPLHADRVGRAFAVDQLETLFERVGDRGRGSAIDDVGLARSGLGETVREDEVVSAVWWWASVEDFDRALCQAVTRSWMESMRDV